MDAERWHRVAQLYESVLDCPPQQRASLLAAADPAIRTDVEQLLAREQAYVVIDRPMLETAAAVLDDEPEVAAGTRLGPYRIEHLIGAGGMGQVYRATDTRLNRTVAIKVLSPRLADNAHYRARFEREAKAIAGVTHPNLCTLHDVGQQDGVDFLVMEYLDGQTLASRLSSGPLPLAQSFRYCIEIADALSAAHRLGIIHRDLKPANIILTKTGAKLLDFGLAKPATLPISTGSGESTDVPGLTAEGTILGTFQYMAPEQLEGKEADARSDIFAFGAVAYEMLTARKAFEGKTQASVIAAIMHSEPAAIGRLQSVAPPVLERIIRTCLAKDPDDRWQSARDLLRELQWASSDQPTAALPTRSGSLVKWAGTIAGLALVAVAGYAVWTLKQPPPLALGVARTSIVLPEDVRFKRPARHALAISPDGTRIVLAANRQLYVRDLADEAFRPLLDTDSDVSEPFFSPDGRWVGFWASTAPGPAGTFRKIAVNGGAPVVIADLRLPPFGATWSADNFIVFGAAAAGIQRVSADGGAIETLVTMSPGELASGPQILPDGEHVLYTLGEQGSDIDLTRQRNWDQARIVVQSLRSTERKVLVTGGSDARYAPSGHLVYAQGSAVWARRLDLSRLEVGEPSSVLAGIQTEAAGRFSTGAAHFSFSRAGTMVYLPGGTAEGAPLRRLALIDLKGNVTPLDLPAGRYHSPRFSLPDGKQIALYTSDGVIWTFDLGGLKPIRRLTLDGGNLLPAWSRDGRVIYRSTRGNEAGLFWQRADGNTAAERLTDISPRSYFPYSVSPDGRTLVLLTDRSPAVPDAGQSIVTLPLTANAEPRTLFEAKGEVLFSPSISPDGRWLAYEWRHEGKNNIFVDPYPAGGVHRQVTTDGASNPMWSPDGRRLFYLNAGQGGKATFYGVEILPGIAFDTGKATELFSVNRVFAQGSGPGNIVDLSPDGKRFVTVLLPPESEDEIERQLNVVTNWWADVNARVQR